MQKTRKLKSLKLIRLKVKAADSGQIWKEIGFFYKNKMQINQLDDKATEQSLIYWVNSLESLISSWLEMDTPSSMLSGSLHSKESCSN